MQKPGDIHLVRLVNSKYNGIVMKVTVTDNTMRPYLHVGDENEL